MNVRRARDEDQPRIRGIVDTLWSGDEMWRPDRATNYLASGPATVLVAGDEEAIIGVGSFRPARLPDFGVAHLDVMPGHQRRGIGTALLTELRRLHRGSRFMARARPWDRATMGFLPKHGFSVGERVVEGWVEPAARSISTWIDATLVAVPTQIVIEPLSDSGYPRATVADVLDRWFERHHPWLPDRKLTSAEAIDRYLGQHLPGTAHVATVAGELVGAGVLVPDPFARRERGAHLVYLGVGGSERSDETAIVRGLLAACLASARDQARPVQFEVQDRHRTAWRIAQELPTDDLYEGLVIFVE